MSWAIAAPIIASAGGNMLAQYNAQRDQDDANKIMKENARDNMIAQKEYAQHGLRWKVEDARAAGLHPLAALGASTTSFSPVSVGYQPSRTPDYNQAMGQDISRAIQATRTEDERRLANLQLANAQADLDGKTIDNQIRASQLQKMNQTGPAFPSAMDNSSVPGQGNAVKVKPSEVYASSRANSGVQSGMINSMQYTRETSGNIGIAPSTDAKERNEDDFIAETMWHLKNRIMPPAPSTKDFPIPKHLEKQGYRYWFWNPLKQEFVPSKNP